MWYLIVFFIFLIDIFGAPRRRVKNYNIISKFIKNNRLKQVKNNRLKEKRDKKLIENNENIEVIEKVSEPKDINKAADAVFSEIVASVCAQEINYGHIFTYFKFFLNNILLQEDSSKARSVFNELLPDIDVFFQLIDFLTSKKKEINFNQIKSYILENHRSLYELYFSQKDVLFSDKTSYAIELSPYTLLQIYNFFEDNKDILKRTKEKKKLEDNIEENLLYSHNLLNALIKNNMLFKNEALDSNEISITKKNTKTILKDGTIFLEQLAKKIEEDLDRTVYKINDYDDIVLRKIINSYLYYLFLKADIISKKDFENIVKKTILDKEDIAGSFKIINEAFNNSESFILNLWKIVSRNKELFSNSKEYRYIQAIDAQGGMSEYLKKYIIQKKLNKTPLMKKVKEYLPAIGKAVGIGVAIAGGIYAAQRISGKNFIQEGMQSISNFIQTKKDSIFNWFQKTKPEEILYQTSTTNFIEQALVGGSRGLIDTMTEKVKEFLPSWFSKGAGSFTVGMGMLWAKEQANSLIMEKVLQPIAKTLGFHGIDVNFSFYKYTKNKVVGFFTDNKIYCKYNIPGNTINESLLIQERFKNQKSIQDIIMAVNKKDYKYIERMESLFHNQMRYYIANRNQIENNTKIYEAGRKAEREEIMKTNQ
jgi:hypothetical protein